MTGSVTMSNGSRAIGRASTNGMPWTIWSPRDRRHRIAYAPSESIKLLSRFADKTPALANSQIIDRTRKSCIFWKKSRVAFSSGNFADVRFSWRPRYVCGRTISIHEEYIYIYKTTLPPSRNSWPSLAREFNLVPCQIWWFVDASPLAVYAPLRVACIISGA